MKWTEQEIPNLAGKIIVVTGANSGIGYEATKVFVARDAEVIMACRSLERGEKAFDQIKKEIPEAKSKFFQIQFIHDKNSSGV